MINGPFLTYQERGEAIERKLRRLSMVQLRSRFRNLFHHSPRNRLGQRRNSLIHRLVLAYLEPGLNLKPPKRLGAPVKVILFHLLKNMSDMPSQQMVEYVKHECPESRLTVKEIPWYRYQFRKLEPVT